MKHQHPWAGYFLAAIGVIGTLIEVWLHIYGYFSGNAYELNHMALIALTVIGFIGFYLISPKGAEGGADIITRNAVQLLVAVRSGRRNTDQFAVPVVPGAAAIVVKPNPTPHPEGSAAPSIAGGNERTDLDQG